MSKWLKGNIKGSRARPELYATEEQAIDALTSLTKRYEVRGLRVKAVHYGPKFTWEVWDKDGDTIAVHWLDDEEHSPQPDESLGPRTVV